MEEIILYRYLSDEASEEEVQQVFEWVEESDENRKELIRLKQTWALAASADEDEVTAWNEVRSQINTDSKNITLWVSYLKYAVIAILLVGIGAISQKFLSEKEPKNIYAAKTSFEVPVGQMSCVVLPDGSLVHLNSESKLSYANDFSAGKRVVELSGEGYFNVQSDKEHPFIVRTPGKIHVKVHGTAFNLRAYNDESKIYAVLEEGSISIIDDTGNELTKLEPGDKASYSVDANKLSVSKVRTELFSSWKDGMITFRNERLGDIAQMMQRWYNVEIVFDTPQLAEELYNGTIMKNKPLDQILEVFRITSSIEYSITPRTDKPTLIYWKSK
uniref:FecR domain-containing protein n=1 Tax=uncultured Draconibacterium sp. TaxID=1573823 RepID=UPI003217528C